MSQLDDLKKSLVGLSDEAILEMVRGVRANRKISKKKLTAKKKESKKVKEGIDQVLAKMSDDDRSALLEKIKAKVGDK